MTGTGPLFSISAVARMIGVPVATLRTWEDRYALVVPERTPSRHRLYTREQLEQLQFIKARIEEGSSAADAHRLLQERSEIETQAPPASPRESPPRPSGKGPLIVLAENDPFSAEFQEYFLKAEGFQVTSALDYDSAVKAFDGGAPALVVIELLVSGGLGLDLCRYLKHRTGPHRILAVSSLESERQALDAGADAFLLKPLDPVVYVSTVNELVRSGASKTDQSAAV